jgi:crotonobetainyl-CoA:carnitine CoA-transferase CaiB-like acyl-CoA transferase
VTAVLLEPLSLWLAATNAWLVAPDGPGGECVVVDAPPEPEPLLARLAELGIPAGKVRALDEVYGWEQTASQGLLVEVDHRTLGPITLPGPPLRFFAADGTETTPTGHRAPPLLDEHGADVRAWLDGS